MPRPLLAVVILALPALGLAPADRLPARADTGQTETEPPRVRFVAEVVELTVEPDSLRVDGTYRLAFAERATGSVTLLYPYPRDPELGGARTASLAWRPAGDDGWRPLPVRELATGHGCLWTLPVTADATVEVRTTYRQRRLADYARYIVTTTAHWGRPLERARFVVQLPRDAEPTEFSFPFSACGDPAARAWCYETENFLPDHDVTVRWR